LNRFGGNINPRSRFEERVQPKPVDRELFEQLLAELKKREDAKADLGSFAQYVMGFTPARHHRLIINKIMPVLTTPGLRIIISAPPGSAKSTYSTVALSAWILGQVMPEYKLVTVSHTKKLADNFARKVRAVVANPNYGKVFSDVELAQNNKSIGSWALNTGVEYLSIGVGGGISGHRADLLIVDDPIRGRGDAESPVKQETLLEWWYSDAMTRIKPQASVIIIATRWTQMDLIGNLISTEGIQKDGGQWDYLELPALCKDPATDAMGREIGEALWPEWQPISALLKIKNGGMPIKDWESMYQCSPTAESGNIVEREHLKHTFRENELPPNMRKYHSWDTAGSDAEKANPTVCGTWGVHDGKYYLLNVRRGRWTFREIEANVVKWYHTDGVSGTLIENKSAGAFVIQNLKLAGTPINIFKFNPEKHGSKRDRFEAVSPTYEAARVLLPEKADWKELYIEELVNYPGAISGDDQVDMSSQFLIWANRKVKKRIRVGRIGG